MGALINVTAVLVFLVAAYRFGIGDMTNASVCLAVTLVLLRESQYSAERANMRRLVRAYFELRKDLRM